MDSGLIFRKGSRRKKPAMIQEATAMLEPGRHTIQAVLLSGRVIMILCNQKVREHMSSWSTLLIIQKNSRFPIMECYYGEILIMRFHRQRWDMPMAPTSRMDYLLCAAGTTHTWCRIWKAMTKNASCTGL